MEKSSDISAFSEEVRRAAYAGKFHDPTRTQTRYYDDTYSCTTVPSISS